MRPLTLLLKPVSGTCNMNCTYCYYRSPGRAEENGIMSDDTVDVLIKRIGEVRPSMLSVVFQGGEPTLAGLGFVKRFICKVKEQIVCPVSYALQTNGLLIDEGFAQFFRENGFLVGVSIDGDGKTNDRYRLDKNGNSVFERTLYSMTLLEKYGVAFNVLSVIDDANAADIETTWAFFKKQGYRHIQFIPYVEGDSPVSLSAESYEAFLKRSFDLWYDDLMGGRYVSVRHIDNYLRILRGSAPENCAMSGVCGHYYVVEADGSLYPCDFYCKEEYRLGSVYDADPFAHSKARSAFADRSRVIHAYCGSCQYHLLCRGGCMRDRTEDGAANRYCAAYRGFFAEKAELLKAAAEMFAGR